MKYQNAFLKIKTTIDKLKNAFNQNNNKIKVCNC